MKPFQMPAAVFFAVLMSASPSWAQTPPQPQLQTQTVERAAKGQPGKDIQVGIYLNVQPDCTSGPLPTIRLLKPPEHGKVAVKKAKLSATNYKQCLALEVPGFIAFYRSAADFVGSDVILLEVKYQGGRVELQKITVTVVSSAPVQRI
jgi:hypothetical protein